MTQINEIYKCNICGNVVQVKEAGKGTLVCCGEDMSLTITSNDSLEQTHKPIIKKEEKKITVCVSEKEHPMTKEHHIQWIEINVDGSIYVKKLNVGDSPSAEFKVAGNKINARILCNKHGIWKSVFM
jgi:superoxide reductase